jgi:peroxiredoxin
MNEVKFEALVEFAVNIPLTHAILLHILLKNGMRCFMAGKTIIRLGKIVKDFALQDQFGQDFVLSRMKGRRVLLSFHPLAWTPVCTLQMQSLEKNKNIFDKFNAIAVGLSVDSSPSKAAWAKAIKIKQTKLLADFWPHGNVAKSLGLFREKDGISQRANVIVDEAGKVCFVKVYPISELPKIDEIIAFLKNA